MGVSIRILVHELEERFGIVREGELKGRRQCADVRFLGTGASDADYLYVADAALLGSAKDTAKVSASAAGVAEAGVLAGASFAAGANSAAVPSGALVLFVGSANADVQLGRNQLLLEGAASVIEAFAFLQDVFARYHAWQQEMDLSIIRDEGLQGLFDVSEGFLRNNTIVVDPALKLLAYTKGIPCDDPITVELIRHGYHTEENIRKFKLNRRFEPWASQNGFIINDTNEICLYTTAVYSFKAAGSFSLIVVMMCNNADPKPWLLDTFMMFLTRVAYYSMRDYGDGTPSGSAFSVFVHDILKGRLTDCAEIEERRRYLGIPSDGPFCLTCVDLAGSQPLAARIVTDIARAIAPAKAMLHGTEIVVLCFSCHGVDCPIGCKIDGCPPGGFNVLGRLESVLREYNLAAGRSVRFDALPFLPTALQQARIALRRAGGVAALPAKDSDGPMADERVDGRHIFNFDDSYFGYLVDQATQGHRELLLSLRGCRQLKRVKDHDDEHGTDNYEFLRQYLQHERRTTVVAEKLHMHRNNVKYRADRLCELFFIDTENDAERLELTLAYRILDALER